MTIGITNEASSALAKIAEHLFLVHAGRRKAWRPPRPTPASCCMLYLLAYALGADIALDDLARMPDWTEPALDAGARRSRAARSAIASWSTPSWSGAD